MIPFVFHPATRPKHDNMTAYRDILPVVLACLLKKDTRTSLATAIEVIDIRSEEEIAAFGGIPGSINIPCSRPSGSEFRRIKAVLEHLEAPAVIYCHSGRRSATLCAALSADGYVGVYDLAGGLSAWLGADLPVEGGGLITDLLRGRPKEDAAPAVSQRMSLTA